MRLITAFLVCLQLWFAARALGNSGDTILQQPLSQALEIVADKSCLDHRRLVGFVRLWLGRSRVPADIHIFVKSRHPRGITIEIERGETRRERTFDSVPEDCAEAHAALGLAIALALDADALQRFAAAESARPSPRRLLAFGLGAGYRVLPGPSMSARAGFEAAWLEWLSGRIDLFSHYSPDNALGPSMGRYDAFAFGASAQACMGGRAIEALRLALCTGAGIGAIHAQGRDYLESNGDTGLWVIALNTLRAELRWGPTWIIDLDLVAPFYAPSILVERDTEPDRIKEPDLVGMWLTFGPAFDL